MLLVLLISREIATAPRSSSSTDTNYAVSIMMEREYLFEKSVVFIGEIMIT